MQSSGKISDQVEILIKAGGGSLASAASDVLLGGLGWKGTAKPSVETTARSTGAESCSASLGNIFYILI